MLSNFETHAYISAFIIATLGLGYILDRSYNQPEPKVSQDHPSSSELPPSQDSHVPADTVPQVALEPPEQCCVDAVQQPEPAPDAVAKHEANPAPGYQRYAYDYRNDLWPSPRPVNFVKALVKSDHVHIEGRLSHGKAIELLASRAGMTPEMFLKTDPITYTKIFMPSHYNAAMLLGQSIQRLEDTIRRHKYLAELRLHG
jgi:hypothetical protein